MTLAKNIRYLRKKNAWSQDFLAEKLGYKSYTTIQKWEMGVSEPPLKVLKTLAELFDVDMNDLANVDLESPANVETYNTPAGARIPVYGCIPAGLPKPLPGLMQVSGMTYSVNPDLTVSDVKIVNQDGSIKYSLDELKDDDTITCVYDSFLATGVVGLSELAKDINSPDVEYYDDVSRQVALNSYLINNTILYPYQKSRILFK